MRLAAGPARPGPQPLNRIAPTAGEQVARALTELDDRDAARRDAPPPLPDDGPAVRRDVRTLAAGLRVLEAALIELADAGRGVSA